MGRPCITASGLRFACRRHGDRDCTELLGRGAELDHVPAHDRREVHRLREPAERHFEVLFRRLGGVHLAGAPGHRPALRCPRDRKHVQDVARLALGDGPRREVRRGRRPRHAATPRRRPQLVRRAEVLVERGVVEVGKHAGPREPVDIARFEPGVGDRRLGRGGPDLAGGAPRGLGVFGLADPGDRHLAADIDEFARVTPVGRVLHASNLSNQHVTTTRTSEAGSSTPGTRAGPVHTPTFTTTSWPPRTNRSAWWWTPSRRAAVSTFTRTSPGR